MIRKYQKLWRPMGEPGRAWWADLFVAAIVVGLIVTVAAATGLLVPAVNFMAGISHP